MYIHADWKERTIERVSREIGFVGSLIVDQAIAGSGIVNVAEVTPRDFMHFLNQLKKALPDDIDGRAVADELLKEFVLFQNSRF